MKSIIRHWGELPVVGIVRVIAVVLWLLSVFGVLGSLSGIRMGKKLQIYYKDWGTGEPVVFSHGWGLSI